MKHKNYTVIGAKLSLPNKKFQNHRKIFRKSFNNLKILENIDNENDNNKNIYSKTSSKRITNKIFQKILISKNQIAFIKKYLHLNLVILNQKD